MRVIAGKNKGTKLFSPKNLNVRPTEDRVRENVFNLISHNLYGTRALDLFSGSGAIGIEFLSRGSKEVYFLEKSPQALDIIRKNLDKTNLNDKASVVASDSIRFIQEFHGESFDYIYIDPPYKDSKLYFESIKNIKKYNLANKDSVIITEEDVKYIRDYSDYLNLIKEKKYGNTCIRIWSLI
ncbi:16S rRNA (guanine(966)-N(2))-methyltransferase RsmD [Peptoniphilus catoniae]|uniref:16S rRNA (guanine(966)-N(2))-methyltransferase RsmD n=1 Tax=Peptoniphilus catoniae TaxID=1660341 RepID=UPI0010FD6DB8|nr:16S rRNA (guanine(966)-N(2))-methyltransferase RsmD [Peptoniphilus catoniae]